MLLLINIILHSWKELIFIILVFNILRVITDGIHAQSLKYCFIFSTIYFTILAVLAKYVVYNVDFIIQIIFSSIIVLWSIFNYKNIPKDNINKNKNIRFQNKEQELTIEEKRKYYRTLLLIIVAIIYVGNIFLGPNIISVSLTIGVLSVNIILNSYFEKCFMYFEKILIKMNKDWR